MPLPAINFDALQTIIPRKSIARFYPTNPVRQVEIATILGAVTTAGNLSVTVTGAGLTGSPVALTTIGVLLNDTDAQVAAKVRAALAANANIAAFAFVGGSGPEIMLTKIAGGANDATLNIAIAAGTQVGVLAAPTSADVFMGLAANVPVNLIGKLADYNSEISTVERKVPDAIDGLLRADRQVAIEHEQYIELEVEDVKSAFMSIFGSLAGGLAQGAVQFYIVDPDDASGIVAAKTNYFKCTAKLASGLSFQAGEVAKGKVRFTALEKLHLFPNATA